jgi:TATA-box binding protein (TBP) (component of TFIID and TFIIIB)
MIMNLKIVNIVATADLHQSVELIEIAKIPYARTRLQKEASIK